MMDDPKEFNYRMYLVHVRKYFFEICEIKEALEKDNFVDASGIWYELPKLSQEILFGLAPSNGGIFTTEEREKIKLPEFNQSYFGVKIK